jgi:hypothetical protein
MESNTNSDGSANTKTNNAKGTKQYEKSGNLSYNNAVTYMEKLYHKKHGDDDNIYLIQQGKRKYKQIRLQKRILSIRFILNCS